ncbi:hypothetical protein FUT87_21600, partial [Mitsuaria sp. TWR114]
QAAGADRPVRAGGDRAQAEHRRGAGLEGDRGGAHAGGHRLVVAGGAGRRGREPAGGAQRPASAARGAPLSRRRGVNRPWTPCEGAGEGPRDLG